MKTRAWGGTPREMELDARRVNDEPWEPLPGMLKQRCGSCSFWFAVPIEKAMRIRICPDCKLKGHA